MAFLFVKLNEIEHVRDENGVTKTLRVNCTELSPRNFNVNLIKQNAEKLNLINSLMGKSVMIPIKEGTTSDGSPYFQLIEGQIMPVDPNYGRVPSAQPQPQPPKA